MIEIKEGTELDSAIAEAIGTNTSLKRFWPSTDLNDAFYAAEAAGLFTVVRDGPEVHLAKTIDGQWEILTGGSAMGYMTREATPALAICAAILKAKEPPPGYRLLTEGDTLIDSDIYLSWDGTWKNCIVSDKIPRGVGPSSTLYARKIETTIEPPPGYRLLGRDDIVDYGDILIARDANNCDLWKAVDGDKYGNTVGYFVDTYHIAAFARKIEPKPVEPLKGYRLMNGDETIRHGDMFWQSGSWKDTVIGVSEISVEAALKKYARYRITAYARKIEPKYRPFASAAEFMPHRDRWIVDNDGEMLCIVSFDEKRLKIATRYGSIYFLDAFSRFKFEDGTPFGVLESIS